MNSHNYPIFLNTRQREEDSDFSEDEYKSKDFKIQKYEKFKPKQNNNIYRKSIKGAENKVKFLLSNFLKTIESEKNNSSIFDEKSSEKRENFSISTSNKKNSKHKFSMSSKNFLRTNSFDFPEENNGKINNNNADYFNKKIKNKRKVSFNLNSFNNKITKDIFFSRKKSKKKTLKKNDNIKGSKTVKFKDKFNDFVKRTKSFGSELFKSKKKELKLDKGDNLIPNYYGKAHTNKTKNNYSIKKTQSVGQDNSYLNFKNDNSFLNKSNYENSINKNSVKKKKGILKAFKKLKIDSFNESNHNSILSDYSDYILNKKSNELKNNNKDDELLSKDIKKTVMISSSLIKKHLSTLISKNGSIDCAELSNKNSGIRSSIKPKKISDLKSSMIPKKISDLKSSMIPKKTSDLKSSMIPKKISDIKKSVISKKNNNIYNRNNNINTNDNKFKRSGTVILGNQLNFKGNSRLQRLNTHFKSMKKKLKQSLILRPEELDLSLDEELTESHIKKKKAGTSSKNLRKKNVNNNDKNNSKLKKMYSLNLNNNINNLKQIKNREDSKIHSSNSPSFRGIEKSNINRKDGSPNNLKVLDSSKLSENKVSENLKINKKKSIESKKSSSRNSSFEDSVNSLKRKNTIYYSKYRVLVHKTSIYDSLDDEEMEDQEEINSLYILPNSTFNVIFDSILFIMSILSLLLVPFYLAINIDFCRNNSITLFTLINLIIELLNLVDLFLGFFRAFYNWDEQLVHKHKIIIKQYLSSWFFYDLLASIPFFTINQLQEPLCNDKKSSTSNYSVVLDKLHYLLIINRLFKILKIFWNNQAWKIISNKLNEYGNIIVYSFLVFASINYAACLYIFVARNSYPNWILNSRLDEYSFKEIYICSIYILTMAVTTVGYGDITCYSTQERIFQLFLLIIGIMAYSYVVSFFSSYIKKIDERSADFEKRKSILDEIKRSHSNLPAELYDRILRYLKFKNFHEKNLKNIIFDCLPLSLKNNLISEMYKPVIQNFIFFKNFQNTDFIVRVILAFKPILAYKNDILVNEGDMIEDIMFVRSGVLAVEIPINMENPQENINKYLKDSILTSEIEHIGEEIEKTLILGKNQNFKSILNLNREKDKKKKNPNFLNKTNSMEKTISFNNLYTISEKEKEEKESKKKKNISYIKVLKIRENEHFGDVLMFLEQRSPLRIRVKSKKSELFFLKKMDAIKISTSYQNIWRRINKKSVYNFEQMKKSIKNIVQIYFSVKNIKSDKNTELSEDILSQINEESGKTPKKNDYLNNTDLRTIKEEEDIRKSQSLKFEKIIYKKFFKNIDLDDNELILNNINSKKDCLSAKKLERKILLSSENIRNEKDLDSSESSSPPSSSPSSFTSSSSSSSKSSSSDKNKKKNNKKKKTKKKSLIIDDEKEKFGQKVIDAFNGNYKFYKGNKKNINEKSQVTIISEVPSQEGTLKPLKYTNSFQKFSKIPSKKNRIINTIYSQKSYYKNNSISENEYEEENMDNIKDNFNIGLIKKKSNKTKNFSSKNTKQKLSLLKSKNKRNINIIENNIEEESDSESFYNKEINKEIYPGEIIKVNKEEDLLFKKVNYIPSSQRLTELIDSMDNKNSRLQILLKSFEDDNESQTPKNKYIDNKIEINYEDNKEKSSLTGKVSNHFYNNKNYIFNIRNDSNENLNSSINNLQERRKKNSFDNNILKIHNDISFNFNSSYDNLNIISGGKLIKDISLQNKLKNYLSEESQNLSYGHNSGLIKKTNSFAGQIQYNKASNKFMSGLGSNKRRSASIIYNNHNMNLANKQIKKKGRRASCSLHRRSKTASSLSQMFERTSSVNERNIEKTKKSNNKFNSGIDNEINENKFGKRVSSQIGLLFNNNFNSYNSFNKCNSNLEFQKKTKSRRSAAVFSSLIKSKKKKDSILSKINFNIQKTNQNLNNPDEFYSNYFNALLEGEKNKRSSIFLKSPMNDMSKSKKEKDKFTKRGSVIK